MVVGFYNGFSYAFAGLGLIFKPGVRLFVWIPLLINVLVFAFGIWFLINQLTTATSILVDSVPGWLEWLSWLILPLAVILIIFVVYFGFTLLANFIAAPFNSWLSERVEARLRNRPLPQIPAWSQLPAVIRRTIWSELRKLGYQCKWLFLLVIISIIPGINLLAPFAWLYFGAWVLAIEYAEYPMGNQGFYFAEVKKSLKVDRSTSLGLGCGIMLITVVPVLNFLAMPAGVAAGTVYWVKRNP